MAGLLALAALIALATQRVGDLALQRFFDNQAQRQPNPVASSVRRPQVSVHQGAKLLARALRRGYHPGDWIILDGGTQGCVVETDWRATHILTPDNDLAIIPNSIIAKARLISASQPVRAHGLTIIIRLEPTVTPSGGRVALQAALLSCNRILRTPAPTVAVRSLDAVAAELVIIPDELGVSDFRGYQ